jgi:hypothetical protein
MQSRTRDPHDTVGRGTDDLRRKDRGRLPTGSGARERDARMAAQRRPGAGWWAIVVVVLCTALSACASAKPEFVVDDFSRRAPRVLALMPVDGVVFDPGNDPNIAETLVGLLEGRGYTVRHVIDGPQGADQARKRVDDYEPGDWSRLARELGVDGIFRAVVTTYDELYVGVARRFSFEMRMALYDGASGEVLWRDQLNRTGVVVGLLPAAVAVFPEVLAWQLRSLPPPEGLRQASASRP